MIHFFITRRHFVFITRRLAQKKSPKKKLAACRSATDMASSFDDARRERHARELEEMTLLLRFPFGCGPLVDSHRRCMEAHRDWRPCDALRVRDAAPPSGEKRISTACLPPVSPRG